MSSLKYLRRTDTRYACVREINAGTFNPINSVMEARPRASRTPCRFDRHDEPRNLICESRAVKPYIVCARYGRKEPPPPASSRPPSRRARAGHRRSRIRFGKRVPRRWLDHRRDEYIRAVQSNIANSPRDTSSATDDGMTMRRALTRIFIDLCFSSCAARKDRWQTGDCFGTMGFNWTVCYANYDVKTQVILAKDFIIKSRWVRYLLIFLFNSFYFVE